MEKEKITAIVLAGGSGKRMGGGLKKQYPGRSAAPFPFIKGVSGKQGG